MEKINMVLCGLGGQGILFMTKVLARTALEKGMDVLGAETHGMAQRGGSEISHLRLGPVNGSLVNAGECHHLLALDEYEAYRNLPFLAPGSRLYANVAGESFPEARVRRYGKVEVALRRGHVRIGESGHLPVFAVPEQCEDVDTFRHGFAFVNDLEVSP